MLGGVVLSVAAHLGLLVAAGLFRPQADPHIDSTAPETTADAATTLRVRLAANAQQQPQQPQQPNSVPAVSREANGLRPPLNTAIGATALPPKPSAAQPAPVQPAAPMLAPSPVPQPAGRVDNGAAEAVDRHTPHGLTQAGLAIQRTPEAGAGTVSEAGKNSPMGVSESAGAGKGRTPNALAPMDYPAPVYPALSRRLGEEGRVLLRVWVGPQGRTERVEVKESSGYQRLDQAAVEAAHQWRHRTGPASAPGQMEWQDVPVRYSLR